HGRSIPASARAGVAAAAVAAARLRAAALLLLVVGLRTRHDGGAALLVPDDLAVEHPRLDADDAVGRPGLGRAVVDVGADRLQRHAALGVPLGARLLGAAEAAGAADLDPAGARLHRALDGLLHRAAEREAALELFGDALSGERGVRVGVRHLLHVHRHVAADELAELGAQRLDRVAAAADHDAGLGRVDRVVDVVRRALDLDARDAGMADVLGDDLPDLLVLGEQLRVVLRA